jgi:hypothetical protein
MAVVKEWRCLAHGAFDSSQGVCPSGCSTVIREFRTAPGTRSAGTKASDAALERLADKYGLSDMSNRRGSVGDREKKNDFAPVWGKMPVGNNYEVGKGEVAREGAQGGANAALKGLELPIGKDTVRLDMAGRDAQVKQMEKALAPKLGAIPTFGDVAKSMPRPRPLPQGKEPGKASDLDTAISRTA